MSKLFVVVVQITLVCCFYSLGCNAFLSKGWTLDFTRSKASSRLLQSSPAPSDSFRFLRNNDGSLTVEDAILKRKSCKRFKRYDGTDRATGEPSLSDPTIVQLAYEALEVSRRTPSAFNTQPFKVVLVHSPEQKTALSKFSLGPNKGRVLDSDCTAVFLADRKIMLSFLAYRKFVAPIPRNVLWRNLFYISIFSSGYPFPRFLSAPLSFLVRSLFGVVHFFTRGFYPMPSLSSAETWASKQALMYAMSFLLVCTSRGAATIPMEGLNASSIRNVLGIPSRYAIPLMISVGRPYYDDDDDDLTKETNTRSSPRYAANEVIFSDKFLGRFNTNDTVVVPLKDMHP